MQTSVCSLRVCVQLDSVWTPLAATGVCVQLDTGAAANTTAVKVTSCLIVSMSVCFWVFFSATQLTVAPSCSQMSTSVSSIPASTVAVTTHREATGVSVALVTGSVATSVQVNTQTQRGKQPLCLNMNTMCTDVLIQATWATDTRFNNHHFCYFKSQTSFYKTDPSNPVQPSAAVRHTTFTSTHSSCVCNRSLSQI